jgi:hypothetical protein
MAKGAALVKGSQITRNLSRGATSQVYRAGDGLLDTANRLSPVKIPKSFRN